MISYPSIDPEIVSAGPFALRWYGLMYVIGFAASYALVAHRVRKAGNLVGGKGLGEDFLPSLYSYLVAGLVIGARLGYALFYDPAEYFRRPGAILAVWEGGMSFHGGLIGTVAAGLLCCRKYGAEPWAVADLIVPTCAHRAGSGKARQLHQRRALRQGDGRSLDHGLSGRRPLSVPSVAAL